MAAANGNGGDSHYLELRKHLLAGVAILVLGGAGGYAVHKDDFALPRKTWCHVTERSLPAVPAHAQRVIVVTADNGLAKDAEQLKFYLEHRLRSEGNSPITFIDSCHQLTDAQTRELLNDPRVLVVVDAHNEDGRGLRARIFTKHQPAAAKQLPYDIVHGLLDSEKLAKDIAEALLEPFKKLAVQLDTTVLADSNPTFQRAPEADRRIDELAVIAALPPLVANCEVKFWQGDLLLFGGRLDEAEHFFRQIAGCASDRADDLQERALFRIGMIYNKKADIEQNTGLREAYRKTAIEAFDLLLKSNAAHAGRFIRPALTRLAALSLQLPAGSVSSARWHAIQGYFRAVVEGASSLPPDQLNATLAMTMTLVAVRAEESARGENLQNVRYKAEADAAETLLTQKIAQGYVQGVEAQRAVSALDTQILRGQMQAQYDEIRGKLGQEKTRISALGKQVGQLASKNSQLEADNAQLKEDKAQANADNAWIKGENSRLEEDNTRLRTDNARLHTERDDALKSKSAAETRIHQLNQAIRNAVTKRKQNRSKAAASVPPRQDHPFLCWRPLSGHGQHYAFAECSPTTTR